MSGPFNETSHPTQCPAYTVATVPDATTNTGRIIFVSDGVAGSPGLAFSDGTVWKRADTPATTVAAS